MPQTAPSTTAPRLLVTAGPTHEPIDAVRYIGNRSSGRLGLALAEAAAERGLPTTLLLGPIGTAPPERAGLRVERFRTADDLGAALDRLWPEHDVLVMAAAVADFTPVRQNALDEKIPRRSGRVTIELEPTEDLLARAAARRRAGQVVIGFALEAPDRLDASARRKLATKRVDAIVANPLETMDSDRIAARVFLADGTVLDPGAALPKAAFARWLLERVVSWIPSRAAAQNAPT